MQPAESITTAFVVSRDKTYKTVTGKRPNGSAFYQIQAIGHGFTHKNFASKERYEAFLELAERGQTMVWCGDAQRHVVFCNDVNKALDEIVVGRRLSALTPKISSSEVAEGIKERRDQFDPTTSGTVVDPSISDTLLGEPSQVSNLKSEIPPEPTLSDALREIGMNIENASGSPIESFSPRPVRSNSYTYETGEPIIASFSTFETDDFHDEVRCEIAIQMKWRDFWRGLGIAVGLTVCLILLFLALGGSK